MKAMADDFESKITKYHEERKEHDLAMQNAQAHQNRSNERADSSQIQDNGPMSDQDFEEEAVDSHDLHVAVELASGNEQETSAALSQRMNNEEAETASSSEMVSGTASASEIFDIVY